MIYDPTRKWQIALTDIILPNNNGHWLYAKVPTEEGLTTSEVFASEVHVDPLRDEGFVIYKMGYAHQVVDGHREISMLWGNVKGGAGSAGKSAYEIAVINGFVGTEAEWLASLQGEDGYTPQKGIDYFDGIPGAAGRGITSIILTSTVGKVKTYTITFTDETTTTFQITDGADGASGSDTFQMDFIFDAAGTITYPCAYALKWTAMIHQQANAPVLSTALNVDMAQYDDFTVTADAAGIVTLTGQWL